MASKDSPARTTRHTPEMMSGRSGTSRSSWPRPAGSESRDLSPMFGGSLQRGVVERQEGSTFKLPCEDRHPCTADSNDGYHIQPMKGGPLPVEGWHHDPEHID